LPAHDRVPRLDRDRAGSLSFELVRALVEKLPIMLTPRWVESPSQPIGVEDLVATWSPRSTCRRLV
jgi:hypothetical protein